jgi:hypothetical protein
MKLKIEWRRDMRRSDWVKDVVTKTEAQCHTNEYRFTLMMLLKSR